MADTSAVSSALSKYRTLTDVPTVYFGDAPPADGVTQIYPPYVVMLDNGLVPEFNFVLSDVNEPTEISFMVYADTLAQVDAVVQKIKYNGAPPSSKAGFDFGTLPSLDTDYKRLEIRRTLERRFVASIGGTGSVGQRVHGCELKYRITIFMYGG